MSVCDCGSRNFIRRDSLFHCQRTWFLCIITPSSTYTSLSSIIIIAYTAVLICLRRPFSINLRCSFWLVLNFLYFTVCMQLQIKIYHVSHFFWINKSVWIYFAHLKKLLNAHWSFETRRYSIINLNGVVVYHVLW